jgi:pimeloyl-ACP methyl ester carboxylesterase
MWRIAWRSIERSLRADATRHQGRGVWRSVALGLGLSLLVACAQNPKAPDLGRLYRSANLAIEQPPLIIIPGITGSQLRVKNTHEPIWPGGLLRLLFNDYHSLALSIDPQSLQGSPGEIEAFDLVDKVAGRHFYDTIVATMVEHGGFKLTRPGTKITDSYERHVYVLPYDWRLDNVESAKRLSELIDQLRIDYDNKDLKVNIVAHSMGGIISRYFLQYGTEDVLDRDDVLPTMAGASKINRIILLGTPSFGSTNALRDMIFGSKIGLDSVAPETMMTMPSVYQLLPNADRKPLIGIDGRPLRVSDEDGNSPERNLFDVQTWRDLKWSAFDPELIERVGLERAKVLQAYLEKYLKRAGRLQKALQQPQPDSGVKLIVFGADCILTPARVLVEEDNGVMVPRFSAKEIKRPQPGKAYDLLLHEPGDGLVGKASLLGRQSFDPTLSGAGGFPLAYSFFLCSAHSALPGNINFQDNLLNALLSR